MDDDEQHLIVLWSGGSSLLQRQQLVDLEVLGVRQGWVRHTLIVARSGTFVVPSVSRAMLGTIPRC
jgi:hypothetical protein